MNYKKSAEYGGIQQTVAKILQKTSKYYATVGKILQKKTLNIIWRNIAICGKNTEEEKKIYVEQYSQMWNTVEYGGIWCNSQI